MAAVAVVAAGGRGFSSWLGGILRTTGLPADDPAAGDGGAGIAFPAGVRDIGGGRETESAMGQRGDLQPGIADEAGRPLDPCFAHLFDARADGAGSDPGDRVDLLDFKGVTKSGQALVMAVATDKSGESVEITSGDAGAFARFAGVSRLDFSPGWQRDPL